MAKVSVREISRATGFSPATVSNALNGKRSVSEETARIIREAAQNMGYQQSAQLDAITFVLARKSGKIVDESTFHPSVIEGVERQARRHGMSTSFVSVDFSDLDAARPQVESIAGLPPPSCFWARSSGRRTSACSVTARRTSSCSTAGATNTISMPW